MNVIIWHNADGVKVEYPNERLKLPGESDGDFLRRMAEFIRKSDPSKSTMEMEIVDSGHVEKLDRSRRKHWAFDTGKKEIFVKESTQQEGV